MPHDPGQAHLLELSRFIADAILQTASEAIVATDREGRIVFWNPGATRIFGFDAAEAVNQSLDIIIPERQRARHWKGFHQAVATGRSQYGDGEFLSVPAMAKDGRRLSVEFTITMTRGADGAVAGMISIMRDVTKRFEEQKILTKKLAALEANKNAI